MDREGPDLEALEGADEDDDEDDVLGGTAHLEGWDPEGRFGALACPDFSTQHRVLWSPRSVNSKLPAQQSA